MNLKRMNQIVSQLSKIEKEIKRFSKTGICLDYFYRVVAIEMEETRGMDEEYILTRLGVTKGADGMLELSIEDKRRILLSNVDRVSGKTYSISQADECTIIIIWSDMIKTINLIFLSINLVIELFREAYQTSFQAVSINQSDKEFKEIYGILVMVHFIHNVSMSVDGSQCRLRRNGSCQDEQGLDNQLLQHTFAAKSSFPDFLSNRTMYDYIYIIAVNILNRTENQTEYMDDGVRMFCQMKGGGPSVLPLWELEPWQSLYIQIVQKYY